MRLFLYYAVHSIKNQLKKLFKTWVAVFFAVCILFGAVIGIGVGLISDNIDENYTYSDEAYEEEAELPEREEVIPWIEIIVMGLCAALIVFNLLGGDKNGGSIFTMADVNLLFASPMKPQSVMLFKLMTGIGTTLVASLYLFFQLPNLLLNLSLTGWDVVAVITAWFFVLAFAKLINVLSYTLANTYQKTKKLLRPLVYACIAVVAFSFYLYMQGSGLSLSAAALAFFTSIPARLFPIVGWITAFVHFAVTGKLLQTLLTAAGLLVALAVLVYIIWSIDADFYEDALSKSSEREDAEQAAREATAGAVAVRKKERRRRGKTEGIGKGEGASVLFFKAMHSRFHFAYFGIFTKTSITYLCICVAVAAILKYFVDSLSFIPVALVLCVVVFFRSLGNPVNADISKAMFFMIPEKSHKKLFYSHLAGTVDCVLDLFFGFLAATVMLGSSPLSSLLWLIFVASIDFYSASVGTFLELAIPESVAKNLKSLIQIVFIYFGLLPIAAFTVIGIVTDMFLPFILSAACFGILCGVIFFLLEGTILSYGKK